MSETSRKKSYNKEFKIETVKYIQEQKKSLVDIGQELNIPVSTLNKWLGQYRQFPNEPFVGSGNLREQDQLLKDQERRIKDLEEENAILKKAMHIFSKEKN